MNPQNLQETAKYQTMILQYFIERILEVCQSNNIGDNIDILT